ncbi:hypothetical protein A4H97_28085 [Niastella yeongjuensis]|uniref:OmpA-like domain-containing protein n=1 Tax=Niastella yeongjuensis TaxID=354355 RepID=A0A1V9EUB0_9BACT|nr:hypothetical protein [Niastella yeongjuensis]OQP49753.1 hypothetical protein A4H97_28085 [Niastella yeongjuensis]SEP40612.1 hypothetical protein SAMN05660816_05818 [Niastella yeongjuensis]
MTRTLIFAGLAAVSLLIPSCFPILGHASSGKSLVLTTAEELKMVNKETNNAIILTARKVKDEDVDPDTGKEIIDNLKEITKHTDSLLTICAHLDSVGRRVEILRFMELAGASIQNEKKTLNYLNDLYNISTHYQFETDTYFSAGLYGILPNKGDEAEKSVGLIVQDIIKFLNDHPRQRFVAVIVSYGFTDETLVKTEAILKAISRACGALPTRENLNMKLSEFRAKSIVNLVVEQIKSNEEFIPNTELVSYDIKWMGKGEELPYPDKIKDYKPEDKRRRLVNLNWQLLPVSLYGR